MKKIVILLKYLGFKSLLLCLPLTAIAENYGSGGDSRCAEYSDLFGKITLNLKTIGQAKIDEINPTIRVDDLWKIKRNLKCLPAQNLSRQAFSYPEMVTTELDVVKWSKINVLNRIRLVAHEMSVLAKYENDGEYFNSDSIVSLLKNHSDYFKKVITDFEIQELYKKYSYDHKIFPSGEVTLINPQIVIKGEIHYFGLRGTPLLPEEKGDGICKLIGKNKAVAQDLQRGYYFRHEFVDTPGYKIDAVHVDKDGLFQEILYSKFQEGFFTGFKGGSWILPGTFYWVNSVTCR